MAVLCHPCCSDGVRAAATWVFVPTACPVLFQTQSSAETGVLLEKKASKNRHCRGEEKREREGEEIMAAPRGDGCSRLKAEVMVTVRK